MSDPFGLGVGWAAGSSAAGVSVAGAAAFTDNFNRANENLEASADWTRVGGAAGAASVSTNAVAFATTETTYLCPDQGSADHYTQAIWKSAAEGAYFLVCVRITDNNNFIGARYSGGLFELFKRVAGTFTLLDSVAEASPDEDVLRLEAEGDQITLKRNDVVVLGPVTETDHQAVTRQGFVTRTTAADPALDNFEAGVL